MCSNCCCSFHYVSMVFTDQSSCCNFVRTFISAHRWLIQYYMENAFPIHYDFFPFVLSLSHKIIVEILVHQALKHQNFATFTIQITPSLCSSANNILCKTSYTEGSSNYLISSDLWWRIIKTWTYILPSWVVHKLALCLHLPSVNLMSISFSFLRASDHLKDKRAYT